MSKAYGNDSISRLGKSKSDSVRKKTEVFLTHKDIRGAQHTITEMVGNAFDEVQAGYGDQIEITRHKDHSVSVRDYGRGVPLGYNEKEEAYNWELIYYEMFAGGKYDNDDLDITDIDIENDNIDEIYHIGTNGLGGFATQASSEFFEVYSYHNEVHGDTSKPMVCSHMSFEKGEPSEEGLIVEPTEEKRGTLVHWKPDMEVFTGMKSEDLDFTWINTTFTDMAYIKSCKLIISDDISGVRNVVKGSGLSDLLRLKAKSKLINDVVYERTSRKKGYQIAGKSRLGYVAKCDVRLGFTEKEVSSNCYHNSVRMDRGITYLGVSQAIRDFFSEVGKGNNVKLKEDDYMRYVTCVVSTYSTLASYEGQTKNGVNSDFLYEMVYNSVYDILNMEYHKGNKDLTNIIKVAVENAIVREQIKAAEKQIKEAKKANGKRSEKANKIDDCRSTDPDICELWIAEGDSAQKALSSARDANYQAIIPIIGKIINCLKANLDKVITNEVVKNIFRALGCGMDIGDLFNISKLKYKKIIIATDADEDGYQIRVLLFLVFYVLAPRLLEEGYVYIAESPLFENTLVGGKRVFIYTKEEQEVFLQENQVAEVKRYKGLGEVNADVLWDTTMNPETRRLVQLTVSRSDTKSADLIDCMFGNDKFKLRKKILMELVGSEIEEVFETVQLTEEVEEE